MRTPTRSLSALAAATAALVIAPSALAADVPVTFDNAVLDTPATPKAVVVDPSGPPITSVAVVNDDNTFTIDPATFDFPKYSFQSPLPGSIDVILNSPATGTIDPATGRIDMTADFQAQVTVNGLGD